MKQSSKNTSSNYSSQNSTRSDMYSENNKPDQYGSVEPLPESSRPRRDGPGGEDGE
ncbi:MAG: hypothetical protein Q4G58_10745 [bacterium]|nr:hypothetical protein [bacterium]